MLAYLHMRWAARRNEMFIFYLEINENIMINSKETKCVLKCIRNLGFGWWLWAKNSSRSLSWILHMETKTSVLFLASAPMPLGARETAREFSDSSWPPQDRICDLDTNISDANINALVQWIHNLHKKTLQENVYFLWLYHFCISAVSFIAEQAFTQLPKNKLRSTLPN